MKDFPAAIEGLEARDALRLARFAMDRAGDSAFWMEFTGRIVYVNDRACASLGYSREELLGINISDLDPDYPASLLPAVMSHIRKVGSSRFEGHHRCKDGTLLPVEISASHVAFEGKDYIVAFTRDVTERQQAERALRASEERYRALYDDNPSMYFSVDPEGTVLSVNTFGAERLGFTPEELVGQPVLKIFHPEDKEAVKDQLMQCLASPGQMWNWEFRKIKKSGQTMWVREDARTVHDRDGRKMVLIVCEDITDRKRMEDALSRAREDLEERVEERTRDLTNAVTKLQQAERKFRSLLESSPDAMIIVNRDGQIVLVNTGVIGLFGYQRDDLLGKSVDALISEPHRESWRYRQEMLLADQGRIAHGPGLPLTALRKNGEEFPAEISMSPIDTEDEVLVAATFRDVSARLEVEKHVADALDLEHRRIAQELHDGVGQHLTGIRMLATSLRRRLDVPGSEEGDLLDALIEIARDAHAETRDLVRGVMPVEVDPEGLRLGLEELTERSRVMYDVDCVFMCPEPVHVEDSLTATHLFRIAQESIHNAVKHGQARRIETTLALRDDRIRLVIEDDGSGIPKDTSTSGGMGLSIMRYRASLVGADLHIGAGSEGGTRVSCTLARSKNAA